MAVDLKASGTGEGSGLELIFFEEQLSRELGGFRCTRTITFALQDHPLGGAVLREKLPPIQIERAAVGLEGRRSIPRSPGRSRPGNGNIKFKQIHLTIREHQFVRFAVTEDQRRDFSV